MMRSAASTVRELFTAAVVATLLALFVRTFLVQAFRIPSDSMAPGLLAGDYILVNKFIYGSSPPPGLPLLPMRETRRGDVIVFRSPLDPREVLVKRCVGLPGETIAVEDDRLFLDGKPQDETGYVHRRGKPLLLPSSLEQEAGDLTAQFVPEDRFFFLGDHRRRSRDSRAWGPVAAESFIGRAVIVYWSVRPAGTIAACDDLWGTIETRSSAECSQRFRWWRLTKLIQ